MTTRPSFSVPPRSADAADLERPRRTRLAPGRSTGDVLLAATRTARSAAAMSLDTGAVGRRPVRTPATHLVELLRTAARPAPRRRPSRSALPLRPLRAA